MRPPDLHSLCHAARLAVACSGLTLVACGVVVPSIDGGPPDAPIERVVPRTPTAPAPPMPPLFTCAPGLRVVALEGASVCEPWPTGRPRCGVGERLVAGLGCVPVADDCGEDAPPELATGAVFVRPGSTAGDGSLGAPFGTIAEAAASGAMVIALSPGTHEAPETLRGRTVVGTCPTMTELRVDTPTTLADVSLRRLGISGEGRLVVPRGAELSLEAVDVGSLGGAFGEAIAVRGTLVVRRTAIHDLAIEVAIHTLGAAAISLEDVSLERIGGVVLVAEPGDTPTAITLTRVVVDEVHARVIDAPSIIVQADSLEVNGLVIEDADGHGLLARVRTASIRDVTVRRVGALALGLEGLSAEETEPLRVASVWIADSAGGLALGVGTHQVSDLVVERSSLVGVALVATQASLARVLVDGAGAAGVSVTSGSHVASDLRVRNVVHASTIDGGALLIEPGATMQLDRASLSHVEHHGIAVVSGALDASDLEIHDVRSLGPDTGTGVLATLGASVTLHRASIHEVIVAGLAVQDATVHAVDLGVAHVAAEDGQNGSGVVVSQIDEGAVALATLENVSVLDVQRWGVIVSGAGASLTASDLVVDGAHRAPCCGAGRGGAAIVVHDGARAVVRRFIARGGEHAGLIVTAGIAATFEQGRIEENAIGLLSSPMLSYNLGIEPGFSFTDVVVTGNRVDFQAIELDVPRPTLGL